MGQFAQGTAVQQLEENLWRAELSEGWRIGVVPNGGYVLAIAGRALSEALPHKDPLSINAFYLAPTVLGPIDIRVKTLRAGGNTTHAEAKMYQNGELKVQVTAIYTTLDRLQGETWTSAPRPDYPSWDDLARLPDAGLEFRRNVEIRLVRGHEVLRDGKASGSGEFSGWITHADGSSPDPLALLLFADSFPPPSFTIFGRIGWVPTLELTVQVRGNPVPGPIQVRLVSRHLTRGMIEEDGEYWDSAGNLVALSRQSAKLRLPQ